MQSYLLCLKNSAHGKDLRLILYVYQAGVCPPNSAEKEKWLLEQAKENSYTKAIVLMHIAESAEKKRQESLLQVSAEAAVQ